MHAPSDKKLIQQVCPSGYAHFRSPIELELVYEIIEIFIISIDFEASFFRLFCQSCAFCILTSSSNNYFCFLGMSSQDRQLDQIEHWRNEVSYHHSLISLNST